MKPLLSLHIYIFTMDTYIDINIMLKVMEIYFSSKFLWCRIVQIITKCVNTEKIGAQNIDLDSGFIGFTIIILQMLCFWLV